MNAICLLGFGEVGQILAADLAGTNELYAFDVLFDDDSSPPSKAISQSGVRKRASAHEAAHGCNLVISAVTAAEDLNAAQSVRAAVAGGSYYLDLNSASPNTKRAAASLIDGAGGRYVEAAVMSPIGPKRIASPVLLGGQHAREFQSLAKPLGFVGASVYSDEIGPASATKMCRSIIIKGIESLLSESMLTARHYRVERDVLNSLSDLFPGIGWSEMTRYLLSRSIKHGKRRAEEMREAVATVSDADVSPLMSSACAARQELAATFKNELTRESLEELLDAILARKEKSE